MTAAVHALLAETRARVAATEDRLARAVIAAAPDLLWQQGYMRADGFDAEGRAPVKTRPGVMIAAALRTRNTQSTRCRGRFWSWHSGMVRV